MIRKNCQRFNVEEDLVERSDIAGLGVEMVDIALKRINLPPKARIEDIRDAIRLQIPGFGDLQDPKEAD